MWLLILHISINVLGLIFLMAGSFQILISTRTNASKIQSEEVKNSTLENKSETSKGVFGGKNKFIEWGWYFYIVGVILGAFQAKITIGFYWTWDLKEILSLLTILGYFLYILKEMKWNKRVKQVLILFCLVLLITTLLSPLISYSYHNPLTLFGSN